MNRTQPTIANKIGFLTYALLIILLITNHIGAGNLYPEKGVSVQARTRRVTRRPYTNRRLDSRNETIRAKKNLPQTNEPILENEFVKILFDKQKGYLLSLMDKKTGTELISNRKDAWPVIFGLGYTQRNQSDLWTDSNRASRFSYNVNRRADSVKFQGNWVFDWQSEGALVSLTVFLPDGSPFSKWNIHVQMRGNAALERVSVPVLAGIGKLGALGDDDRLLVPEQCGRLFTNPSEKLRHWGQPYPSGFATMQFMAYYDTNAGFYVSSLDKSGLSKSLDWDRPDNSWAAWSITYKGLAGTSSNKAFEAEGLVGVFHGDWITAASIYKEWAEKQDWAKITIKNKGTPVWLTNIGIAKGYEAYGLDRDTKEYRLKHRTYEDWVQKMAEHEKFFSVPSIAALMGWEHGGTWASGDYFPPQYGWKSFDKAIQQVCSLNSWPYLLIRGVSVRLDSAFWKSSLGKYAAVRDENGEPISDGKDIIMCLESQEWIQHLSETTLTLAKHGVGVVVLDGFPWRPLPVCYCKHHQHGAAPGCATHPYQIRKNIENIRTSIHSKYPEVALGSEGGADCYLPILDIYGSLSLWAEVKDKVIGSGLAEIIPMFHFVYHDKIIFYQGYGLGLWRHLGGTTYHNLVIGRCFVWGEICEYNMTDWLKDQSDQPIFGLLKRCAKARVGFLKDFLVFGRMLPPPVIEAPLIYVESEAKKYQGKVPSVLSSAWLSECGDVAVIILNIGLEPIKISLSLSTYQEYILTGSKMEIYSNNDLIKSTSFDKKQPEQLIELKPLEFTAFILRSTDNGNTDLTKHTIKDNYKSSQNP